MIGIAANANLQYGDALLRAESSCFTGVQEETLHQSIAFTGDQLSVDSSCGGGATNASVRTGPDWFVISAGSTTPGMPTHGEKAPVIIDAGNGSGAVEIGFSIDRPTLFRMQRCLPGTTVFFWDGDYKIAVLDSADEVTPLPAGTYWATLETDHHGTPMWGEIGWSQQDESDPADINGDGKVNAQDLAELVSMMSDYGPGTKVKGTPGDSGKAKGRDGRKGKPVTAGFTPLPKPKPGSMKGKPENESSEDKGPKKFFDAPDKGNKSHGKGDFDQNGKIDIHDIVYLIGRM